MRFQGSNRPSPPATGGVAARVAQAQAQTFAEAIGARLSVHGFDAGGTEVNLSWDRPPALPAAGRGAERAARGVQP